MRDSRVLRRAVGLVLGSVLLGLLAGCATYYQKSIRFQEAFVNGDLQAANKLLQENAGAATGRDRLLYFFQKGVVLQMLGDYEASNAAFEEAYLFTEDVQKNYAAEALSLITNPMVTAYRGEDFEIVLLHYYKALNFLRLNRTEEALVECRRINIRLNELNDRYSGRENRYRRDAFAYNLMGIIFEAAGEINNAFISYRNAWEVYRDDYREHFGLGPPDQLKQDLLRTAYLNGFQEELAFFEKEFGRNYIHTPLEGGELVFFLNNGLGPVKGEWSINFALIRGDGGVVNFTNDELGISIPFDTGNRHGDLKDLKFLRVAFPRYLERKPVYRSAELAVGERRIPLEIGENVNAIAYTTLEDRMLREFATGLLRLAIKQASEEALRKKHEGLGVLLSAVNAISEKADTRNWQTLPYWISYARVPLSPGSHEITLESHNRHGGTDRDTFTFDIGKGETEFFLFHTLASQPLSVR